MTDEPQNARAIQECARAGSLAATGQWDQAVAAYRHAIALRPNYISAHGNLGNLLKLRGHLVEAETCYRRVLELDPRSIAAHLGLGSLLAAQRRFDEAEAVYRKALELEPDSTDTLNHLGALYGAQEKLDEAAEFFRRVVTLNPRFPQAHNNLATALSKLNRQDEAIASCRQALTLDPNYAEAHNNLGGLLADQGKYDQAEACCRRALELKPDLVDGLNNLGMVLAQRLKFDEAEVHLRRALAIAPGHVEALINLSSALAGQEKFDEAEAALHRALDLKPDHVGACNNLGVLLEEQGKLDAAEASFRQLLAVKPDFAEALSNLGAALFKQDKFEQAEACCRQAIALRPDSFDARNNLGAALTNQEKFDEAEAYYRKLIEQEPDHAGACANLGVLFEKQGRFPEAEACFRRLTELEPDDAKVHNGLASSLVSANNLDAALDALHKALTIDPSYAEARKNRAMVLLLKGCFAEGWSEYEWRWRSKGFHERFPGRPRWDGGKARDARIVLYTEQGYGDTLQCIRYAALVKERVGTVIVECEAPLSTLVATCPGVDRVVVKGQPLGAFDVHAPLLSLPGIFRTDLATIPADVPYLTPEATLVQKRRSELAADGAFNVGIAWHGNPKHTKNRLRSIPLAQFGRLAEFDGVRLYSLQVGAGRDQLAQWSARSPIVDLGDQLGDFHETAALVRNLDLVITCDSSPAHLAGALGVPVWTALAIVPDWRWLLDRDDSPWYPTMRLFRQRRPRDWDGVFEQIAAEFVKTADAARHARARDLS